MLNLAKGLRLLHGREREVIARRHGDGQTLAEVGRALSLSTERVRQIQNAAEHKLEGLGLKR